jgi:hypothetical protein
MRSRSRSSALLLLFQWFCGVISMVLRCHFNGFAVSFQWFCVVISMVLQRHFNGFAAVFHCDDDLKTMQW